MAPPKPGFHYSGSARKRLSYDQVKSLAQAYGLPGDAIAQIAKGESGMYADVQQRDPGDGNVGYGLLQMTPNAWGKGSAAAQRLQQLGGIEAMQDPAKNMAMARFLYKSAGNKLSPWYGTRFLTNRSGEGKLGPVDRSRVPADLAGGFTGTPRAQGRAAAAPPVTTPGVDNSDARRQALAGFLLGGQTDPTTGQQGSGDILDFALQMKSLQDTPGTPTPGSTAPSGAGGDSGGLASTAAARAEVLDKKHMPYLWGGGHQSRVQDVKDAKPLDCSGAVSAVLGVNPRVSGEFGKWGRPGDGGNQGVTVYSNGHHVLMKIDGHFFGTSGSNPGGGAGWIPQSAISDSYLQGFTARHSKR